MSKNYSSQKKLSVERLSQLYGAASAKKQLDRHETLLKEHIHTFKTQRDDIWLISAPGRIEISGNHTDHNNGIVLAAATDKDTLSAVTKRDDSLINIHSKGYGTIHIDCKDYQKRAEETETSAALVRGVAFYMTQHGYRIGGFDANVISDIPRGSGLSSSAAFEIMIGTIFNAFYNNNSIQERELAIIAREAENNYFDKPCGLMDQATSACGGLVCIDFSSEQPLVTPIDVNFDRFDYAIVVVDTKEDHADLTHYYKAITQEMKSVASFFDEKTLRNVTMENVLSHIAAIRSLEGDRAILRTLHYLQENERVLKQVAALQNGNIRAFLDGVISSGRSSFQYLQNVYIDTYKQPLSLALCLSEQMLLYDGAWRIHGGGFAGTTLNFVPNNKLHTFLHQMESVFSSDSCHRINIRREGAAIMRS